MRLHTVLLAAFLLLLAAGTASAQRAFVQAGYGTDVRRFSAEAGEAVLDGSAGNLSLGGAGFVTPRWTLGVELESGGASVEARTVSVTLAGRPSAITTTYTLQRRSLSALAGFHTSPARRVRLAAYAGVSFHAIRRTVGSDAPPIVLIETPGPSIYEERSASPTAGADLSVAIAPRLALVGTIRAQGLTLAGDVQGFSVRPGGAVRVVF